MVAGTVLTGYRGGTIDAILRRLSTVTADGAVDLRDLRFLRPSHLVGVAALAHAAHRVGRGFAVRAPVRRNAAHYAARMHLGQVLTDLAAGHDLPPPGAAADRAGDLLELSVITSHQDVRRLTSLVHEKVSQVDLRLANALHEALAEVGGNVNDHAGDIGFTVAQTMPALGELRFAVADAGLGLRRTLAERGADSDATAVDLALRGVSRFPSPARGNGLRRTVELVGALGGSVYVASGSASVTTSGGRRRRRGSALDLAGFPGTLVEATIPLVHDPV